MNKIRYTAIIGLIFSLSAFAEFNPPPGGDYLTQIASPVSIGTAGVSFLEYAPSSTVFQPASGAKVQRLTLDLSYTNLFNADDSEMGHGIFLGTSIPTKLGVASADILYLNSDIAGFNTQSFTRLHGAFSKDVYEDLYVGLGVNGYFGEMDNSDFGITADLGFMKYVQGLWGLNDFWYGAVLKDLGKWYDPSDEYTPFPAPFSIGVSGGFVPYENDNMKLGVGGDVLFQQGQDLRLKIASNLTYKDTLNVGLSWQIDMQEIANSSIPARSLIPGLAVTYSIQTNIKKDFLDLQERGWSKSEIRPGIGFMPLQDGAYATSIGVNMPLGVIDKEAPEIKIDLGTPEDEQTSADETALLLLPALPTKSGKKGIAKTILTVQAAQKQQKPVIDKSMNAIAYISPNNDGIQDELDLPFSLSDKRYIKGYALRILDSQENVIREIGNKETRPENASIKDFFSRLFAFKKGLAIPEKLIWDGKTDEGTVAEDGTYYFYISAWDDNGNIGNSRVYAAVVDNTPPSVEIADISDSDKIFSPNNDGNKDTITFKQDGSNEDLWTADVINVSGDVVWENQMTNTAPKTIVWGGTDSSKNLLPDGIYRYRVSATDRAGNSFSSAVDNIIIDTQPTPIKVSINTAYFSPNGDGVKDTITISIDVPQKSGLESWSLSILDRDKNTVNTFGGDGLPPTSIVYEGTAANGKSISEGEYTAELEATFRNGNAPISISPAFTMDITKPDASVSALLDIFSPNGDGNKDALKIVQEGSVEQTWKGEIVAVSGKTVKTFSWLDRPAEQLEWDGMTDLDILAEDGEYRYRLSATDMAGNTITEQTAPFKLSTAETAVMLIASSDAFSPNNDGKLDSLTLTPDIKVGEGVDTFSIEVFNSKGVSVYKTTGTGQPQKTYQWRGVDTEGNPVPEGVYYAQISIIAKNGNPAASRSRMFTVDRTFPKANLTADYTVFSPNGDNKKDTVRLSQTSSDEALWTGTILDKANTVIRQYQWKGSVQDVVWDGTDAAGNPVSDGTYSYVLRSEDAAENAFSTSVDAITVDNRRTTAYVTSSSNYLSPNGDGKFETIDFKTIVTLESGITRWDLVIADTDNKVVKVFSGQERIPQKITWNGVGDDGKIKSSKLTATFSVEYEKGDMPMSTTSPFSLDVDPPVVHLGFSPIPFSPDNDGVDDELSIKIDVQDESEIQNWSLEIVDRQMVPFVTFSGTGMPKPEIIWNGIGRKGDLVIAAEDYPYRFTVTDMLGNTARETGIIPIDVLVIRDGDKLKIQIASINFEPDKAELSQATPEIIEKNTFVLNRLAQILKKYRSYGIVIEGHANPTKLRNEQERQKEEVEELKPLSEARAQTVRQALIERGINGSRIKVIGMGGTKMIAEPLNKDENWKNRRVEFILEK